MPERDVAQLGALIQAYLRSRWGDEHEASEVGRMAAAIEPELKDRVDILGLDGEALLEVQAEAVLAKLEALERAAALEDGRVSGALQRHTTGAGKRANGKQTSARHAARNKRQVRPDGRTPDGRTPDGRPSGGRPPGGRSRQSDGRGGRGKGGQR